MFPKIEVSDTKLKLYSREDLACGKKLPPVSNACIQPLGARGRMPVVKGKVRSSCLQVLRDTVFSLQREEISQMFFSEYIVVGMPSGGNVA